MHFVYIQQGSFISPETTNVSFILLATNGTHFSKTTLLIYPTSRSIQNLIHKNIISHNSVVFYNHHQYLRSHSSTNNRRHQSSISPMLSFMNYLAILLLLSGDIELNPGPTGREEFTKLLDNKQCDSSNNIFSREEIMSKISTLKSQKPKEKNES